MKPGNSTTKRDAELDRPPVLRRALGLWSLVLFGLVYIGPLVVFTTYGIITGG